MRRIVSVAALLAGKQAWRPPCCHLLPRIRPLSIHASFATKPLESLSSSCSSGNFETHLVYPQSDDPESIQPTPVAEEKTTRQPLDEYTLNKPTNVVTCQENATHGRAAHPTLEPAPFPRDLHFCISNKLGSGAHKTLQSFEELDHNTESALYRGTLFEYRTQEILRKRLGIYTQRSAGSNDLGIDLRGTWFLPLSAAPKPGDMVRQLKVIVQCKTMSSKVGPKYVRELQGSLSYETQPTMAILAASSEFTKQALVPYAQSLWPMALVVIDTETQQCRKLMWNQAAEKVMHGIHVGTEWVPDGDGYVVSLPVLCFQGKVIERLPGPYLNEVKADEQNNVEACLPSTKRATLNSTIDTKPESPQYL
ncbi:MAG: hypothetical protein J3Q66DRAFT_110126 [Benniella sp.]|nr:MAG: hypothetical protein J3Q66DRAFT_110126 [Benniella sp.]